MPFPMTLNTLPPLPPNKTVTDIFADFLGYLMSCAEAFIGSTHTLISDEHEEGWSNLRSKATFVLAHPNGWEGPQQMIYRKAAIMAGLVPQTLEGKSRVVFVTEGEASLHYCGKNRAVKFVSHPG